MLKQLLNSGHFLCIFSLLFFVASCSNNKTVYSTSLDAGRAFIRASLDGDFREADQLILKDSQNMQLFDSYKSFYNRLPADKKKNYKEASYEINKYVDESDSVTIINYSNDYMKKPMDIKLVKVNHEWKVDFKYAYSGNLPTDRQ